MIEAAVLGAGGRGMYANGSYALPRPNEIRYVAVAFTEENARSFKVMGTRGQMRGKEDRNEIEVQHFGGSRQLYYPAAHGGSHGGADRLVMSSFVRQLEDEDYPVLTSGMQSAKGHLIAFAAELFRKTGRTIDMHDYIESLRTQRRATL